MLLVSLLFLVGYFMISTKVVVNSNGTQIILSNYSGNKGIRIYFEDSKLKVSFGNGKTCIHFDPV